MKEFLGEGGLDYMPVKNESCFPKMTLTHRLYGVAICFGIGFLLNFFSAFAIAGVFVGKPTAFALLYTLGNIVSITGTFFLMGPARQFKNMTKPTRIIASLIFVSSMVMTFIAIFVFKSGILTIIFVLVQFCSLVWYMLSYVPYGREMCTSCMKSCCCSKSEES